jgi:ATP-binding cassette subfamily C protein LapB
VARSGKIVAHTQRIGELLDEPRDRQRPAYALSDELRLERVQLRARSSDGPRYRLSLDQTVAAGSRIAVLGGIGSGKSSLLQVLAGSATAHRGRVLWDGVDVSSEPKSLRDAVAYLPEDPRFACATVKSLLGEAHRDPNLLHRLGTDRPLARLATGEDVVLEGATLTARERRALVLPGVLDPTDALWALDCPLDATPNADRTRLSAILDHAGDRTLFVALRYPCLMNRFTHVWVMRKGKVAFAGSPLEWKLWKTSKKTERRTG